MEKFAGEPEEGKLARMLEEGRAAHVLRRLNALSQNLVRYNLSL